MRLRPLERHALARLFQQRIAIGVTACSSRPCRSRVPRRQKRGAEVALGRGPFERHALARPFQQRVAIGGDGVFEARGAALAFPSVKSALPRFSGSSPSRAARARASYSSSASRKAVTASSRRSVPLSRSPSVCKRVAEQNGCRPRSSGSRDVPQHSAGTFDGDFKGEIDPLIPAIVQVFVVLRAKCLVPCGPFSHVLHGYEMFDLLSDRERRAQNMLLDGGIEERNPLALNRLALCCFASVDFSQCVAMACAPPSRSLLRVFSATSARTALTKASSLLPRSPRAMTSRAISTACSNSVIACSKSNRSAGLVAAPA